MEELGVKEQRIYLGNLPKDVKLPHLLSVLPRGFDADRVEMKHNYDVDKNVTSTYAFANLKGNESEIKSWCDNISKKSLGGQVIQVQFAKLSFLERLKQEVDSQRVRKEPAKDNLIKSQAKRAPQLFISASIPLCYNGEEATCSDSESETDKLVKEFNKNRTVTQARNNISSESNMASTAEVKRLQSIKEKSSTHDNQQRIIKLALKKMSKDPSDISRKIKFEDSDTEMSDNVLINDIEYNKRKLFDESNSENENEFVFDETKPKTRLVSTQVSTCDERFRMDSKFFDDEEIPEVDPTSGDKDTEQGKLLNMVDSLIAKDPNAKYKIKKNKMNESVMATRFDPLVKNHNSLVIKQDYEFEIKPSEKVPKVKPYRVTRDKFYDVSDNLKEQFKKCESTGFSVLGLISGSQTEETDIQQCVPTDIKVEAQMAVVKKQYKNPFMETAQHFFNVDEDSQSDSEGKKDILMDVNQCKKSGKASLYEPLFLTMSDPRIEEALSFFNSQPTEMLPHSVVRFHLKKIVTKKHRRNVAKSKELRKTLNTRRKFQRAATEKKMSRTVK